MNTIRSKGVFDMAKSANLYARIEPDLKEKAESILTALGIPASNAITMFYKQIILQNGLPFEVKLPEHPLDVSRMTASQLDAELEKGYADAKAGRTIPVEQAFANVRKEFGV
nr:MAG TPA: addiction module antitoxin [Caudoviricetes sp.]